MSKLKEKISRQREHVEGVAERLRIAIYRQLAGYAGTGHKLADVKLERTSGGDNVGYVFYWNRESVFDLNDDWPCWTSISVFDMLSENTTIGLEACAARLADRLANGERQ